MFTVSLQNDAVQHVDGGWDQLLLSVSEVPSDAWKDCANQNQRILFSFGLVRSRNSSKQWTAELPMIGDGCENP